MVPDLSYIEQNYNPFLHRVFSGEKDDFWPLTRSVFTHQYRHNPLYHHFARYLDKTPDTVKKVEDIPFLPISFFKSHVVLTDHPLFKNPVLKFGSSGTTGTVRSFHHISDAKVYRESLLRSFHQLIGEITDFNIFALLPSYLEREDASLVYMVKSLMEASGSDTGGFFLDDFISLEKELAASLQSGRKTLLLGVSFALLSFGHQLREPLPGLVVVETGGMKGMQREMVREELHHYLKNYFGVKQIFSEYGMTELCSQAWSVKKGLFLPPPWMKVLIRDLNDPFSLSSCGKAGGVNIIDLANIHSCSFIETSDIGKSYPDGSFEILGRIDGSEPRGCNLMVY